MEICERVFLGDLKDLERTECTAILSLYNLQLNLTHFGERKLVYRVEDSPTTDLLTEFPRMVDFIKRHSRESEEDEEEEDLDYLQKERKENTVLIHCQAGSSRSVTVVLAFLIAEKMISSVEEGLSLIVEKGGSPNPNSGFLNQLELWQKMGGKLDANNPDYKQYRMQAMQETMMLQERPANFDEIVTSTPAEHDPSAFKCKKCRRACFLPAAIIPHEKGESGKLFYNKTKRRTKDREVKAVCSSLFLEPMQWMEHLIQGRLNGLLVCPKCSQKVGHFDWSGMQCSCGRWVSPAIQVQRKQVDAPPGFF